MVVSKILEDFMAKLWVNWVDSCGNKWCQCIDAVLLDSYCDMLEGRGSVVTSVEAWVV